jgi:hypothetical protein
MLYFAGVRLPLYVVIDSLIALVYIGAATLFCICLVIGAAFIVYYGTVALLVFFPWFALYR